MWRTILKFLCFGVAAIFALLSYLIVVDLVTLARKDQKLLEDMKLRVAAVEHFQKQFGRLPKDKELSQIWNAIPGSSRPELFYLSTRSIPGATSHRQVVWPESDVWAVWVWMGEYSEYYTSWDHYYSPTEPMSWFAIEGWFLFSPIFAVLAIAIAALVGKRKQIVS